MVSMFRGAQTDRSDSHGFQISNQLFDFVLFVHESPDLSQALLRVTQSVGGASLHGVGLRLMSAGRTGNGDVSEHTNIQHGVWIPSSIHQ